MKLEEIGFYSLSDERAKTASGVSRMQRSEIIITETCNFKCPYCRGLDNSIYGHRKIKMLSLLEIKKIIDIWCKTIPLRCIRFSGGEPTLHPDIVEIVEYAKYKGIEKIAISTNGYNDLALYEKLIKCGVNDYSISLDACCASIGDKMAGNVTNSWQKVVNNITELSKLTYVTVGIVFNPTNLDLLKDTILFASSLGVADIRIISSAQFNKNPNKLDIDENILSKHPILKYRINRFNQGLNVRGINHFDSSSCGMVLDDSVIAGDYHFPCVIYMREKGNPIGKVSENMREERIKWFENHDSFLDDICRKNCLDVCIDYNNKYNDLHKTL